MGGPKWSFIKVGPPPICVEGAGYQLNGRPAVRIGEGPACVCLRGREGQTVCVSSVRGGGPQVPGHGVRVLSGLWRGPPDSLHLFQREGAAETRKVEEEEEDEEVLEAKPGPEAELRDEDDKETKDGSFPMLRELTEEERQQILHSSEFQSFFDCSIRVMERALAEDSDIFFDYSGRDLEDKEG
ncbi:hypothetical protein ATANTOWER_005505, partial [Ataeniobius toweri]|nr:hypothetical protein [Ataeniobius toweri]